MADIHFGNTGMTPERLAKIIGQVNASRPDIILLADDFVTGHDAQGAAERAADLTRPLAHLRAPLGVVAVLGNHDYWTAPDAVRAALTRAGIAVLENQAIRRGPFAIVGIGDRFSGHDDVPSSLAAVHNIGGVPIVLTHSPDIVPDLPAGQPLVLAGHTHCGQVVLPWIGPLVMHAPKDHWRQLYNPRYRCGIVRDGARTTIVTAGVGSGTSPIRLGAMPDWWLITLKPWRTFSTILSPVSIQPKLWLSNWCPNHPYPHQPWTTRTLQTPLALASTAQSVATVSGSKDPIRWAGIIERPGFCMTIYVYWSMWTGNRRASRSQRPVGQSQARPWPYRTTASGGGLQAPFWRHHS